MKTVWLRAILLAALLFGMNAWAIRHLGLEVQRIAVVNGFLGFVTIVLGWIDKRDADGLRAIVQDFLRRSVEAQVLIPLFLVAILVTSFISSVTVMADGEGRPTTLFLSPEGQPRDDGSRKSLAGQSDLQRFIVLTSIFGRPMYLEASGYQRQSLIVHPWSGETISVTGDLIRMPGIVLRIPRVLLTALTGAQLTVEMPQGEDDIKVPLENGFGTVQLGPPVAIPDTWRGEWRNELRAIPNMAPPIEERTIRAWRNTLRIDAAPTLVPGQRIVVTLSTADGSEQVRQEIFIGREPIQDVKLMFGSQ